MDISASCDRTDDKGNATSGCLRWEDTKGNRYHIWVHLNPAGTWQITDKLGSRGKLLYKNPPKGEDHLNRRGLQTKHLDHTAKAHAETVRYALEQQNAHHIVEDAQRQAEHAKAQRQAEADAGHAAFMRGAILKFAATLTGEDAKFVDLFEAMSSGLTDAQLNRLSAIIHDVA